MDPASGASPVLLVSIKRLFVENCAWSPDGGHIAYTLMDVRDIDNVGSIYTVPATGGTPERLVAGSGVTWQPAWSPDSRTLTYSSGASGHLNIWLIPAAGGDAVQLTNGEFSNAAPAWSPDGSRIAFASNRSGHYEIWVMSANGEHPTQLTFGSTDAYSPSWSPDGRRISFTRTAGDGIADIWVLYLE